MRHFFLKIFLFFPSSPETFGPTQFMQEASHSRIALNKYYPESSPDYWLVNSVDGTYIFCHQVEPGNSRWRHVYRTEQWIWAKGAPVTVTTNFIF